MISETGLRVCELMEAWAMGPQGKCCVDEAAVARYLGLPRLAVRGALRELEDVGAIEPAGGALYSVRSLVGDVRNGH